MHQNDFSTLKLNPELFNNLASLGYHTMTPIQAQSLPLLLAGTDMIAQAKTGSGKTAAFGLTLLNILETNDSQVQALVLCPTRELANQVAKEIRALARAIANIKVLTLCGGMPMKAQLTSLQHGAHIVVGTPGRIGDHLRRKSLDLQSLKTFVLDEADRMLDMGFQDELDAIVLHIPQQRQTLLFSATFPEAIQAIAQSMLVKPQRVTIDDVHSQADIRQHFYQVEEDKRVTALRLLLLQHRPTSTLIFCSTKIETEDVADELADHGFRTLALHGDLDQREREQTLIRFNNKSIAILVATDVAARGLDIEQLDAVINYRLAYETATHTHRIGRTGRAGNQGLALTLYDAQDACRIAQLSDYLERDIHNETLPPMKVIKQAVVVPCMLTLQIRAGKKQKIRAGDILGALTAEQRIQGKHVGKINILAQWSYVAIHQDVAKTAFNQLQTHPLKGRVYRVRLL